MRERRFTPRPGLLPTISPHRGGHAGGRVTAWAVLGVAAGLALAGPARAQTTITINPTNTGTTGPAWTAPLNPHPTVTVSQVTVTPTPACAPDHVTVSAAVSAVFAASLQHDGFTCLQTTLTTSTEAAIADDTVLTVDTPTLTVKASDSSGNTVVLTPDPSTPITPGASLQAGTFTGSLPPGPPGVPVTVTVTATASEYDTLSQLISTYNSCSDGNVLTRIDVGFPRRQDTAMAGGSGSYQTLGMVPPADITVYADPKRCGTEVTYPTPTATDDCPGTTITLTGGYPSGSFFHVGTNTITFTRSDGAGNSSSCSFHIIVLDPNAPTFGPVSNLTASADPGQCTALVSFTPPAASDVCDGSVAAACRLADDTPITSPHAFPLGTTTVYCTATDAEGNSGQTSFTVTVNDTEKPTITAPPDLMLKLPAGQCYASSVALGTPATGDNCGVRSVTNNAPPAFSPGTTTVTWTVTDAAGNQATAMQKVTVVDGLTLTPGPDVTMAADPGQCSVSVNSLAAVLQTPTPSGGCGAYAQRLSRSDGGSGAFPLGTTTLTWTVVDDTGNQATATQKVTVVDEEKPQITAPSSKTVPADPGLCTATVPVSTPAATDNCSTPTVSGSRSDGQPLTAAYPLGTTTITWTATDAAGNQATCTQSIVVQDTEAPIISGVSASSSQIWPPTQQMVPVTINYSASDNCSAVTSALSVSNNETGTADATVIDAHDVLLKADRAGSGSGRVYTITITSTDASGNQSTQLVTVTVPRSP